MESIPKDVTPDPSQFSDQFSIGELIPLKGWEFKVVSLEVDQLVLGVVGPTRKGKLRMKHAQEARERETLHRHGHA